MGVGTGPRRELCVGLSETGLSEPGASAELLVVHCGALLHKNLSQLALNRAVRPGELLHVIPFV